MILAFLLPAAGCGSGDTSVQPATNVDTIAAAPKTPSGFTVRTVRNQGFSIAVPKKWRSIDASTALQASTVERFARENPAAAGAVEVLSRPSSPMKLVAVDPSSSQFATNVNVLVSRIPADASFRQWTKAEADQIQALHPSRLRQGAVQLAPGKGYRIAYHAKLTISGTPRELAIHQYLIKRGARLYVVTFTTRAADEARLAQTFDQSARTFELST